MKIKKFLLVLLLLLGVGFASVSTTLQMDGNIGVAKNNEDFDIRFTKAVLEGVDITTTAISSNGKILTYTPNNLSAVGNKSTVNFEITNNSEMYDAEVSVVCTVSGNSDYYQIVPSVKSPIKGKSTEKGKAEVQLLRALGSGIKNTFTCTLGTTAQERTTKAEVEIVYYAYGDPLTAADRTTDYTTLKYPASRGGGKANIFVKLEADGVQKSVCTLASGDIECFKGGIANFTEETNHLKEAFASGRCLGSSIVSCELGNFYCSLDTKGNIDCTDSNARCGVDSNNVVDCYY